MFPSGMIDVTVEETSKKCPVTKGEILRFFGIWFFMATTSFDNQRDFWSTKEVSKFSGAPYRFGHPMTRYRFEAILSALTITNRKAPSYKDGFWEVRQLMEEWNDNMEMFFSLSWINCLDESMSKWLSEFTCPGFMCVFRKPWPFGNQYHTICCCKTGILWRAEIVKGKDTPPERPPKKYSSHGKTAALLLRLTEPIWGSGRVVILDSGFCVLKAIVELRKRGVYSSALIKKRRYWPAHIPGDKIKKHFEDMPIGSVDVWSGNMEGVSFAVHCFKEPSYILSLMSTYRTTEQLGEEKDRDESNTKVKYPEVVHNHYKYKDAVDSHNGSRMFPLALEETWKTIRWPLRVLQFYLAITEVNVRLASEHLYNNEPKTQIEFRKEFAKSLIYNKYIMKKETPASKRKSPRKESEHVLVKLDPFTNFDNGGRIIKSVTRCVQRKCQCGSRRVHTYCKCSPGIFYCNECFSKHQLDSITCTLTYD